MKGLGRRTTYAILSVDIKRFCMKITIPFSYAGASAAKPLRTHAIRSHGKGRHTYRIKCVFCLDKLATKGKI